MDCGEVNLMAKKVDFKWAVLLESLKEPLRIALLALIAWILTVIVPQIDVKWVPVITLALKWVDEWLHEWGKVTKNDTLITGITRF